MNFDLELERLLATHERLASDSKQEISSDKKADSGALFLSAQRNNGFPLRALEYAGTADTNASCIRAVSAWHSSGLDIAILSGKPGCGKTVAATWWAITHAPYRARFGRATDFATTSRYDADKREWWTDASALVLDDLGAEFTDTKGSFAIDLDALVDVFYADKRKLIITTNSDAVTFKARYGPRISDRIRECGKFISISADSMRGRS